ncbi:v-type proton ATPase subunit H [Haematococcus lacustris]|uniref:V-type proton ATPase subunit H n=1 Tax=Haematococcus lacustris TaxID=44745 RepID=A0A6A0A3F2_HAELA|nr:v-type proton ATPase subunit H [Haematococcus lacustris]
MSLSRCRLAERASAERESARSRGAMAGLLEDTDLPATLSKDIQWESYLSARLVSEKDVQLIRRYDKRTPELRASMLEEAGPAYVQALLSVLRAVTKDDTVQYVLALLLQMLQENPLRAKYFHQTPDPESASSLDPYTAAATPGMGRTGEGSEAADCHHRLSPNEVLGIQQRHSFLRPLLRSTACLIRRSRPSGGAHLELRGLAHRPDEEALSREQERANQHQHTGSPAAGAGDSPASSNSPANSQLLYELCLCAWQMTFLAAGADALGKAGIVRPLVEVTRVAQKEKVFRIAMSALRNLLDRPELHDTLAPEMVDAGLQKIVITKQMQAWGDDDIVELLKYMDEQLKHGIKVLSNFDKYKREVASGQLDWSPMHTSEAFWKEHADKFEERDFMVLRALLKLLETSREVKTLAVACSDVGMFIVHHPQGRYIVNDLRGKELVMRLMAHPDPDVQKQALLTVQKIMITRDKLEFLTGSSS